MDNNKSNETLHLLSINEQLRNEINYFASANEQLRSEVQVYRRMKDVTFKVVALTLVALPLAILVHLMW